MALVDNKTTGKAVADIKALYFYNHANGGEPEIVNELESQDWFPVLTMRGTVTASQDAPSIEKLLIRQCCNGFNERILREEIACYEPFTLKEI